MGMRWETSILGLLVGHPSSENIGKSEKRSTVMSQSVMGLNGSKVGLKFHFFYRR